MVIVIEFHYVTFKTKYCYILFFICNLLWKVGGTCGSGNHGIFTCKKIIKINDERIGLSVNSKDKTRELKQEHKG
jgi:hypothetical protein